MVNWADLTQNIMICWIFVGKTLIIGSVFEWKGDPPSKTYCLQSSWSLFFRAIFQHTWAFFKSATKTSSCDCKFAFFSLSLSSNQKEQMQPASKSGFSKPMLKNETVLIRYINSIILQPIIFHPTTFTSKNQSKLQTSFGSVKTVQILDNYFRSKRFLMSFLKIWFNVKHQGKPPFEFCKISNTKFEAFTDKIMNLFSCFKI